MAYLETLKNPGNRAPYRVRWTDPLDPSKKPTRSFTSKPAAKRFLRDLETALDAGTWVDPDAGRITLDLWAEHAQESWNDLRPSTRQRARDAVRTQIVPRLGTLPLRAIDTVVVQKWVNDLTDHGYAPATVRKAYNVLSRLMTDAVVARRIQFSPCVREIRLPKLEKHVPRFLTMEEIDVLAGVIAEEWKAFVYVGATSGLRLGELLALRWGNVDLLRREIRVLETVVELEGRRVADGPPKTKASLRTVPMSARAHAALIELAGWRGGPGPGDLVFPDSTGGHTRPSNFRHRVWAPAVKASGLGKIVPHELRHSAVVLWLENGATLVEAKEWAGHSTSAVLLDVYGHRTKKHGDRVFGALDAAFDTEEEATG